MKKIFLIVVIGVGFACSVGTDKPKDLLSEIEMVSILTDVHILEAKLSKMIAKKEFFTVQSVYITFERELFEKHGTSKEEYETSFEYYMSDPKKMELIYAVVVDSLNVKEQKATIAQKKASEEAKQKTSRRNVTSKAYSDRRIHAGKTEVDSLKKIKD